MGKRSCVELICLQLFKLVLTLRLVWNFYCSVIPLEFGIRKHLIYIKKMKFRVEAME